MDEIRNMIFYNHFGAGDIFESREFVKDYMTIMPNLNFFYAHGKHPRILQDIPNLNFCEVTDAMHPMNKITVTADTIYINTWIGRDGRYVLPGIGCTVEKLYEMHNNILHDVGMFKLTRDDIYSYIPKLDFSYYATNNIHDFLVATKDTNKVLISNGPVQSNQAFNFDFTPVIDLLCRSYPDIIFIATSPTNLAFDNLYYTEGTIKVDGFDLNNIAYLSVFTDIIIGRSSGPHTFSQHIDNWLDHKKVNLAFTYMKSGSHFVLSDHLPMKKEWSPATETKDVFEKICEVIDGKKAIWNESL
jgi:hypothetical protein